jgi:Tfp pilus assembly protein PilN
MKAVNLIPAEERRNTSAGGRSGGAAYALLGVLGVLVLVAAAYALSNRQVSHRKAELAQLESSAAAAEAKAQGMAGYTDFTSLRQKREQTVKSIAASRFDWAHALHEVARTIPANAWLTSLVGTVAPGVNTGGGASPNSLRGSLPVPAIDIAGCTTSQKSVARMLVHMRQIDGVQQVALESSSKSDSNSGGSGTSAGGGGDCRNGNDKFPTFAMTIFFKAVTPIAAAPATTASPAASTTTTTPSSTPTSSTTSTGAGR